MAVTRFTQSAAVLPNPRKGPLSHPAVLVPAGFAILLGAYALGYLPQVGSLLEDAIRSSRSEDMPVLSPAFYGIAGLAAFLILLGMLRSFDLMLRKLRDTTPLKTRPAKSIDQFIAEAADQKVSLRVARESFLLLEPQYPHRMCIDLTDNLRADLHLSDDAIHTLEAQLFTRCDRRQVASNSANLQSLDVITVCDLLQRTEAAPPMRADRSASRERATDLLDTFPVRKKRHSDSAQRKALHAATLQAIESGSLHMEGASGLHRRDSDYSGPRRRATDQRADIEYSGPYQRATDKASDGPSNQRSPHHPDRQPDRRPDRPPATSPERKAQPTSATVELSRLDSLFLTPKKRTPETTRTTRPRT